MGKRQLCCIFLMCVLLTMSALPAWANSPDDEIGAATTMLQQYRSHPDSSYTVQSNVSGSGNQAERFIDQTLELFTRLVPFSLDATIQYYPDRKPTTFLINFRGRNYNDQSPAVQQKVQQIASEAATLGSQYEQLRYINSYLVDHCQYDTQAAKAMDSSSLAFTAYGCLIQGSAVCEGYANSVQLLCQALDIPCIKVAGTAYNGNHIWNAVYLQDKWWMLDVTFNDPIGHQSAQDHWEFFLLDLDSFFKKGIHQYDAIQYQTTKEIYSGYTTGQLSAPFSQRYGLTDAVSGDVAGQATMSSTDTDTLQKAQQLKEQGIFVGDERGFRLEEAMNRIEMGVMVMRMNNGLPALRQNSAYYLQRCPFTDVPQWARSSIGFLYDRKLVAGQSSTRFGTDAVTKRDYAVMMLRLLQVDHTYQNALQQAVTAGILTQSQAGGSATATRGDIVEMTYATLQLLQKTA